MFSLWLTVAQNPFLVWGSLTAELGAREGRGALGISKEKSCVFPKTSPSSMDRTPRTGGGSVWDVGARAEGSPLVEVSVMLGMNVKVSAPMHSGIAICLQNLFQ